MADWADAALASEDLQLAAALEASLRRAAFLRVFSSFFIPKAMDLHRFSLFFIVFPSIFHEFVDNVRFKQARPPS